MKSVFSRCNAVQFVDLRRDAPGAAWESGAFVDAPQAFTACEVVVFALAERLLRRCVHREADGLGQLSTVSGADGAMVVAGVGDTGPVVVYLFGDVGEDTLAVYIRCSVEPGSAAGPLTAREVEVLRYLALGWDC